MGITGVTEVTEVKQITKDIGIEDLINQYAFSMRYLAQKNIRCIPCGDSTEGTLEGAALEKGFNDEEIQAFVDELRELSLKNY